VPLVDLFRALAKNVLQIKTSIISTIQQKLPTFSRSVLHQKYVLEGLSAHQIAEQTASSKSAVLAALRRFEIPLRAHGSCHGRPSNPPYGWKYRNGKLVEFAKEQKAIELIRHFAMDRKWSVTQIARELSERDIPTKTGKSRWHHEMVRQVLKRQGLA
jgi:hypothetical protein